MDEKKTEILRMALTIDNNKGNEKIEKKASYGIDRYAYNQGYDAKYDFQIFENEEPCLVARGGAAVCCPRSLADLPK